MLSCAYCTWGSWHMKARTCTNSDVQRGCIPTFTQIRPHLCMPLYSRVATIQLYAARILLIARSDEGWSVAGCFGPASYTCPFFSHFHHFKTTMARSTMPITKTGMRGAAGIVGGPAHHHDFFPADALLELVSFLPHQEVRK